MPTKKTPIKSLDEAMKNFNKNNIEVEKQKIKDEKAMRREQAKEAKMQAREEKKQAKEVKPVKPVKPVKKKTAYTSYISQKYAELKAEGKDSKEIFKELAIIWGSMTEIQKSAFKAS